MRFLKHLLPALLIAATAGIVAFWIHTAHEASHPEAPRSASTLQVGADAPEFSLVAWPKGEKSSIASRTSKVRVINFWASWCGPCMLEMPSLQRLHDHYRDRGLEVLAVNVDEESSAIDAAAKKLHLTLPLFSDTEGALGDLFQVEALPHTIILDAKGKVLHREIGDRDWMDDEMKKSVEAWLK